jgi:hypothetical protein
MRASSTVAHTTASGTNVTFEVRPSETSSREERDEDFEDSLNFSFKSVAEGANYEELFDKACEYMRRSEKKNKEHKEEIKNLKQYIDYNNEVTQELRMQIDLMFNERNITQRKKGDETKLNTTKRVTMNETNQEIPAESNETWGDIEERFQTHILNRTPNPYINNTTRSMNNSRAIPTDKLRPPPFTGGLDNHVRRSYAQVNESRNSKLKLNVPIKKFKGERDENVDQWLDQLEFTMMGSDIPVERRIIVLGMHLEKLAYNTFHLTYKNERFITYEEMKDNLRNVFLPTNHQMDVRNTIKSIKFTDARKY